MNRTFGTAALLLLAMLVLPGEGRSQTSPPPFGFTNGNVSGSYGFRLSGWDEGDGSHLDVTGVFAADGAGNINSGSITYHRGAQICGGSIIEGTYSISADGEGVLLLPNTAQPLVGMNPCRLVRLHFAIALDGFDANGIAHGIELGSTLVTRDVGPSGIRILLDTPTIVLSGVAHLQ